MSNTNAVGVSPLYKPSSHSPPFGQNFRDREVHESTPLLSPERASRPGPRPIRERRYRDDPDEDTEDDDEFDNQNLVERTISYSSHLGIEPESLEQAMFRTNSRERYSGSQRASRGNSRRPSTAAYQSVPDLDLNGRISEEEDEIEGKPKSPYMNGISRRLFWLIYSGVMTNVFIATFDSTIMASSHPVITSYFHSSNSASWLSTAFLLTSTAFQPLFGRLSDTMGRKKPYMFGMFLFLAGTIWCALAQSMLSFIFARALTGLGAGGMLTMGSIITSDLVPIEIRGNYQSYINIVFGSGSALGAATGGFLADNLGWRWEFGIQVPPLLLFLILAYFNVPSNLGLDEGSETESLGSALRSFDFKGSITLSTGVTAIVLALSLGGNVLPWTHPVVIAALVYFVLSIPFLIYFERHHPRPVMPLWLLVKSPRNNMIVSNFFSAIVINAILFNIPIYFQAVLLESATSSGLRLLVPTISAMISGVSTGFLITWSRRLKWPVVLGGACLLLGPILLSAMEPKWPLWATLIALSPASVGQGFQFPGTFIAILSVSEQAEQAVVTSTLLLWRNLGMVIGVSSSSLILQNSLVGYLDAFVDGIDKDRVIQEVRESIESIAKLAPHYRNLVVKAYASSLRVTFIATVVIGLIGFLVIVPIRLPRLPQQRKMKKQLGRV